MICKRDGEKGRRDKELKTVEAWHRSLKKINVLFSTPW
jgi:hypothetical protein